MAIVNNVEKSDKIQLKNMEINFKVRQQPDTNYINENGLYSLLLSRSKELKKIFEWVKNYKYHIIFSFIIINLQ